MHSAAVLQSSPSQSKPDSLQHKIPLLVKRDFFCNFADMSSDPKLRTIDFENIANVRELGGIEAACGRKVKKGLLLRGASLHNASESDLHRLETEYGVRHIFDFRTELEVKTAPDKSICGAGYTWLPTIDPDTDKFEYTLPQDAYRNIGFYIIHHAGEKVVQEVAKRIYSDMVLNEYSQLQYSAFLNMIAAQKGGAVYWHCSQGKDRTGLGAAFVLAALGADREEIMQDYAYSNVYYSDLVSDIAEKIMERGGGQAEMAVVQTFIGVNTDYFNKALDLIESQYGSLQGYIRDALLFSDEDMLGLQRKYLEE